MYTVCFYSSAACTATSTRSSSVAVVSENRRQNDMTKVSTSVVVDVKCHRGRQDSIYPGQFFQCPAFLSDDRESNSTFGDLILTPVNCKGRSGFPLLLPALPRKASEKHRHVHDTKWSRGYRPEVVKSARCAHAHSSPVAWRGRTRR